MLKITVGLSHHFYLAVEAHLYGTPVCFRVILCATCILYILYKIFNSVSNNNNASNSGNNAVIAVIGYATGIIIIRIRK